MSSRPAWSTLGAPRELELHRETQSQKQNNKTHAVIFSARTLVPVVTSSDFTMIKVPRLETGEATPGGSASHNLTDKSSLK